MNIGVTGKANKSVKQRRIKALVRYVIGATGVCKV